MDALLNIAGVMLLGAIEQQDAGEWDKMFDVNVKSLLNGMHAVISGMIDRKRGTIMNISSVAGPKTFTNYFCMLALNSLYMSCRKNCAKSCRRIMYA
nr:SDR family NAD(P)-dependent oxidoreductase [Pantoea dispersa]